MHERTRGRVPENEPESPPAPANDDARAVLPDRGAVDAIAENEPEPDPWDALPAPARAELDRLLAADDWPGLAALGATGALRPWGRSRRTSPRPRRWAGRCSGRRPPERGPGA